MIGGAPFWRDGDDRRPRLPALRPVESRPVWVSPSHVITFVCRFYRIEEAAFFAHRRADELVSARALVVWLLRTVPAQPMNYCQIGRAIERHRTDVMHLHKTVIALRLQDRAFKRVAEAMRFHFQQSAKAPGHTGNGGHDHASL
jgi:chromosomal replication initiation ATPase DnaA